MVDREIRCCICNDHVGVIRDAKLKIGLKFICKECESTLRNPFAKSQDFPSDFMDFFKSAWSKK